MHVENIKHMQIHLPCNDNLWICLRTNRPCATTDRPLLNTNTITIDNNFDDITLKIEKLCKFA